MPPFVVCPVLGYQPAELWVWYWLACLLVSGGVQMYASFFCWLSVIGCKPKTKTNLLHGYVCYVIVYPYNTYAFFFVVIIAVRRHACVYGRHFYKEQQQTTGTIQHTTATAIATLPLTTLTMKMNASRTFFTH